MSKAIKAAKLPIPDDSQLGVNLVKPLTAGFYVVEIKSADITTIRNGQHAGKPVLNLKLATIKGRILWKQIPLWAADTTNPKEVEWVKMSRVALVKAIDSSNKELIENPERIIGEVVNAKVGIQQNEGYAPQNFVITFQSVAEDVAL